MVARQVTKCISKYLIQIGSHANLLEMPVRDARNRTALQWNDESHAQSRFLVFWLGLGHLKYGSRVESIFRLSLALTY